MNKPRPFRIHVEDGEIAALNAKLLSTRWPDEVNDEAWSYGMQRAYLQELTSYWQDTFDWRRMEASINYFDQFLIEIDGLDLHFIHYRSVHERATAMLLTHGWPGSIVEFLEVIPRLTDPERFGGHARNAFHVVCPSLPGYGYSAAAHAAGMHPGKIAARHAKLMEILGYDKYIAQGGDWGAIITQSLAQQDSQHCQAIHLNFLPPVPPVDAGEPKQLLSEREIEWIKANEAYERTGKGYMLIQRTRPQTLAYALSDSPVGLCAWIAEKFYFWCDAERDGIRDIRNAISWDRLLTNISLYYFTGTIASSMRLYREFSEALSRREIEPRQYLNTPTGIAVYPSEMPKCPRSWAQSACNLVHWFEAERGGHFAAMEQPQMFAENIWAFHNAILSMTL